MDGDDSQFAFSSKIDCPVQNAMLNTRFLKENGLQESCIQLLKELRKYSTGFLRLVYMYSKFALSVYRMPCMRC